MKNILYAGLIVLASLSFSSCASEKAAESNETSSDTAVMAPTEQLAAPDSTTAPAADSAARDTTGKQ